MLNRRVWLPVVAIAAALALASTPLRAAEDSAPTVAHIKLSGNLDETPVNPDPLFGGANENFKSKIDRIKKAAKDDAVKVLFLEIDGLEIGWGKLDALTREVSEFRKGGKKAVAYMESADGKDYLLATACDEICLPESGWLMLTGVRAEMSFYKDLLDKVGVKADILRMGDAKSAAEEFTRTSMSDASRKQLEGVIDDYYEHSMVERIAARGDGKKFTTKQVKALIDKGPYTARAAEKASLIDHVLYREDVKDLIKAMLKTDKINLVDNYGQTKAEDIDLSSPFAIFKLLAPPKSTTSNKPKIAVIYATGVINTGKSGVSFMGEQSCGSQTMIEAIRQAEEDKTVKAIVLRVDSPGGSALASDLIWSEVVRCKKPVVASMSDVAASGGYYISMGAQKIYAEPSTLTGSIGVFGGKMALAGVYEKLGINTEVVKRGENANIFSTTSPFSDSEKAAMTALMHDAYDQFLDKAIAGRKKAGGSLTERKELEKLAGGRIWTGRQAKENGLVDELGNLDDALAAAKKLAGVAEDKELELLILPKPRSFLDTLLDTKGGDSRAPALELQWAPLLREMPELATKIRGAEGLLRLRGEHVWLMLPYQIEIR
jgi:protease-4